MGEWVGAGWDGDGDRDGVGGRDTGTHGALHMPPLLPNPCVCVGTAAPAGSSQEACAGTAVCRGVCRCVQLCPGVHGGLTDTPAHIQSRHTRGAVSAGARDRSGSAGPASPGPSCRTPPESPARSGASICAWAKLQPNGPWAGGGGVAFQRLRLQQTPLLPRRALGRPRPLTPTRHGRGRGDSPSPAPAEGPAGTPMGSGSVQS